MNNMSRWFSHLDHSWNQLYKLPLFYFLNLVSDEGTCSPSSDKTNLKILTNYY